MSGEIFDPEIHATDKDGNPSLNKDGSFRKKRKDSSSTKTKSASSSGSSGGAQRDRYYRGVAGILQIPAAIASMVDPVDGYCAARLIDPMSAAIADLAVENPQVAAAVDRMAQAGPFGAVLSVGIMAVVQFAHNHDKIPAGMAAALGATPRSEIEKILQQRGEQLAKQRPASEPEPTPAQDQEVSHDYASA